jgi:hypothetical protein
MLRRFAVLVNISTGPDPYVGLVRLSDVAEGRALACSPSAFVLTLEVEDGASFAQGQLRPVEESAGYPIRTSRALFERIDGVVNLAGETE